MLQTIHIFTQSLYPQHLLTEILFKIKLVNTYSSTRFFFQYWKGLQNASGLLDANVKKASAIGQFNLPRPPTGNMW
jgi:hypothetical protein